MAITINTGSTTIPTDASNVYGMAYKFAKQIIENVSSVNPLDELFNKGKIEYGRDVEEAVLELLDKGSYDENAVNLFAASDPTFIVRWYKNWSSGQFSTTVRLNEIRKILSRGLSERNTAETVAEKIVSNLTESDSFDRYKNEKGVLTALQNAIYQAGYAESASTANELLKKMRNIVDDFQFINSKYTLANIENRSSLDDIRIVMPFNIKNAIDIDAMAYMFNMEKADLLAKILVTDETDGAVYILDKRAVFQYNRLLELTDQWNGKALLTNYWYTVDDMYGYSPLFKATYIDASAMLQ